MDYQRRKSDENVFIADTAVVVGDVTLEKGVSVWFQAVVRGDEGAIHVGENTNIQDAAILHSHTTVGKNCTIGHGAILHSETRIGKNCTIGHGAIVHGCTVGDDTLIGMGSILLNGAKIGKHCLVGAGALVTGKMDAPDGSLILGSPAKVVRPLTEAEREDNRHSVEFYLSHAEGYR